MSSRLRPLVVTAIGVSLAVLVVVVLPAGTVAPRPPLDVMGVTQHTFREQLHQARADQAVASGTVQPLTWIRPLHSEADVEALIAELRPTADRLVAGPHTTLVSTQNSIKAQAPVIEIIAGWSNDVIDLFVMRQKFLEKGEYRTYGIAHDRTSAPPVAYFFEITDHGLDFGGNSCFACHPSGARYLRPLRPDLVSNPTVLDALNARIEETGRVQMHYGSREPAEDHGEALSLHACDTCHSADGARGPLYRVNAPSIRALVATGAMPKVGDLTIAESDELETWLAHSR